MLRNILNEYLSVLHIILIVQQNYFSDQYPVEILAKFSAKSFIPYRYTIYILILLKCQQLAVIQAWDGTEVSREFLNMTKSKNSYVSPFGQQPRTGCSTSMLASTFPMVLSVSLRLTYNVTRTIIAMHDYASRKRCSRVGARSAERV